MRLAYDQGGDRRMRAWIDMTLMSLTFFLTIIWSVQVGVTVSLIISLLLVVRRSSKTRMAILVGVSSIKQDVCFTQMHRAR
jgi:MFS superfamily sulfate permease-like transporter